MLINKSAIIRSIRQKGLKPSKEVLTALDAMVEQQIVRACASTKVKGRKIVKRDGVFTLFV
jgi:lipoate-protein ligase B